LYLKFPLVEEPRCPVVPTGTTKPPFPGSIGSLAIAITGELAKLPSVTAIWLVVPSIVLVETVVGPVNAKAPVPVAPATAKATPVSAKAGAPATPSPLVTDNPVVDETIVLATTALLAVLAIMPLEAASRLPEAAFKVI
jgi:hypothetical protein